MLSQGLYLKNETLVIIILKSHQQLKNKQKSSGYSLFTHCLFDATRNKLRYKIQRLYEKNFKYLREHAIKIIKYEIKETIPLTIEEKKLYHKQRVCYRCKEKFNTDDDNGSAFKRYHKVRDHFHYPGKYRGVTHNIRNLRYKISKGIPVVFHSGFKYGYHFIIKEPSKEFEGQFTCLGKNIEKYTTF